MLLIRNEADSKSGFTPDKHQEFLKSCEVYIEGLKKKRQLISAQPLIREGTMIYGSSEAFKEGPFSEGREVIVGYYHILAKDLAEAILIAKGNPEFAYTKTARVEVRPIKMKEESTAFEYPRG